MPRWPKPSPATHARLGWGEGGDSANISVSMVDPAQPYTAIPLPIGLIQVLGNWNEFNPSSDKFDPISAIEGPSNSLH